MARETLESLRVRLLSEHSVQTMIRMRAYEIYQMRGGQPGGEAQDWFHAEGEVLAYLIANESEHGDEPSEDQLVDELVDQAIAQSIYESIEDVENTIVSETADSIIPEEKPTAKKPRSRATKSSTSKAASQKKQATTKKSPKSKSKSETVRKKSKTQPAEKDTLG